MIDDMLSDLANKFNAVTSEITAKSMLRTSLHMRALY